MSRTVKVNDDGSTRTKKGKQRWTQAHLPFPGGQAGANCMRTWRNQFQFTIIHWAGSQDDPFGTNAQVGEAIDRIWPILFSQVPLDDDGKRAVIGNVCNLLLFLLLTSHLVNVVVLVPDNPQSVAQSGREACTQSSMGFVG